MTTITFANVTNWSAKARDFLTADASDIVLAAETHVHDSRRLQMECEHFTKFISAKRNLVGTHISILSSAFLIFGGYHRGSRDPKMQAGNFHAFQGGQFPFIVLVDFNEAPTKLQQDSRVEEVGASIMVPSGADYTSSSGSRSHHLDLAFIRVGLGGAGTAPLAGDPSSLAPSSRC